MGMGIAESTGEDGWVVCRVFKKKNYQKTLDSPKSMSMSMSSGDDHSNNIPDHLMQAASRSDEVLDQILVYMGRTCKLENHDSLLTNINASAQRFLSNNTSTATSISTCTLSAADRSFLHLPRLDSPSVVLSPPFDQDQDRDDHGDQDQDHSCFNHAMLLEETSTEPSSSTANQLADPDPNPKLSDWAAFDRLVASQLNGHEQSSKQLSCFGDPNVSFSSPPPQYHLQLSFPYLRSNTGTAFAPHDINSQNSQVYTAENELWSFTKSSSSPSSSDPLCHLSV